ncbi:MAG TPA: hypothetical protein VMS73_01695 [Anaerolineaceae bacterium]|nr:hypothetical protein [Anaerolineaceae bacterium]
MQSRKSVRVSFWILVSLILILFIVQGVVAAPGSNVKYIYYGKEWSPQEMLTRFAHGKGKPFHCVQHVTSAAYRGESADLFYCWDTEEEAKQDSINQSYEQAKVDEYFRTHPWPGVTPQDNLPAQPLTICGHWALYYNSGYNGWIGDYCNGQSNSNIGGGGVWSLWRDGNPNNITIYYLANFGGGIDYTYTNAQWTLVGFPFGGGGGHSARVP